MTRFREWAISQHRNSNHFYDSILPYEFHLEMVAREVNQVAPFNTFARKWDGKIAAAWGHDLLEDTRTNYNDLIANGASPYTADIIYAVTNPKGKNRKERNSDEYYQGIRETPGASIVKVADRIANVKYSLFSKNQSMYEMYKKENPGFIEKITNTELVETGLLVTLESLINRTYIL